jgi:hypothetical protein
MICCSVSAALLGFDDQARYKASFVSLSSMPFEVLNERANLKRSCFHLLQFAQNIRKRVLSVVLCICSLGQEVQVRRGIYFRSSFLYRLHVAAPSSLREDERLPDELLRQSPHHRCILQW